MKELEQLVIPLLVWYRENARVLPWRSDPTPYGVWISEIMLQQTRVAAVLDYYRRFLEAAPAVADLAAMPEDQLMKLWQGLGYYSRARNLQKAARQIMETHGGVFPNTYEEIRALSGVGDYTAGAISSIAFHLPVPAVDGNVLRVAARVCGDSSDITTPAMKRKVTQALAQIIPLEAPGDFNQAMMELGATVCLPNGAVPRRPLLPCFSGGEDRGAARQSRKEGTEGGGTDCLSPVLPGPGGPSPPRAKRTVGRIVGISQRAGGRHGLASLLGPGYGAVGAAGRWKAHLYPHRVAYDRHGWGAGQRRSAGRLGLGRPAGTAGYLRHPQCISKLCPGRG